jgi:hypothetical protein
MRSSLMEGNRTRLVFQVLPESDFPSAHQCDHHKRSAVPHNSQERAADSLFPNCEPLGRPTLSLARRFLQPTIGGRTLRRQSGAALGRATVAARSFLGESDSTKMTDEDENGWSEGYSYQDPDYVPSTHPIERGEVTWHHVWGTAAYSRRRV